jgi:hypothetical protein
MSTENHLYTFDHYFKATDCDKYKINQGLLQSKFHVQPPIKVCKRFRLSARSSDGRPRQKVNFRFKIPSFVVPTGLILYIFRKRNHFCVDCTLFGENWLTINKDLGGNIRPGGRSAGEPFYLYYIYSIYG